MTDDPLIRIRDLADELTDTRMHRERYEVWTGSRNRQIRYHATPQHGLIRQLYTAAIVPALTNNDEPGAGIPSSRPPLEVEALSRHEQITTAALGWCAHLGLAPRGSVESNIRAFVVAAAAADEPQQRALLADLRRWTSWCRVYLGLEQVRQITGVRCPLPECSTLGTLRINLTTSHALCTACGATWDRDNIGVLANHINTSRKTTGATLG